MAVGFCCSKWTGDLFLQNILDICLALWTR
jgi:hypothetical protein